MLKVNSKETRMGKDVLKFGLFVGQGWKFFINCDFRNIEVLGQIVTVKIKKKLFQEKLLVIYSQNLKLFLRIFKHNSIPVH